MDWNEEPPEPLRKRRPKLRSCRRGDAASELEAVLGRPVWPWLFLAGAILFEDEWISDDFGHRRLEEGVESYWPWAWGTEADG